MTRSIITVSLVTFNGLRWLPGCIASLERQTLTEFQLLALDNASTDGSLEWLREQEARLPWLEVESSPTNLGFAAAQNRNIYRANADLVCLLNQDIELDKNFLEQSVAAFQDLPRVGAVQGKLMRLMPDGTRSDVLDSTGLLMHRSRRVVSRGQGQRDGHCWSVAGPVWGADGPAPVYRRAALLDVQEPRTAGGLEILDEDFFMYKEDVDLAWRLRRAGWSTWYEPRAVAWHARTAGAGKASSVIDIARSNWKIEPWIKTLSWRNQRLMQLKNESPLELLADVQWVVAREVASFWFTAAFDRPRLRAIADCSTLLRTAVAKRRSLLMQSAQARPAAVQGETEPALRPPRAGGTTRPRNPQRTRVTGGM